MWLLRALVAIVRALIRNRADLAAENLALRQQSPVLQYKSNRPLSHKRDRIF